LAEEILSFDIIIDAKLSEGTKDAIEKLETAKEESDGGDYQIEGLGSDVEGGVDFLKNPKGKVTNILKDILGSRAAAIIPALAIAITAPVVMIAFIKALSVKGGPLNRDWRRFIQNEINIGLSRQQQKENELGITQTILTQVVGFNENNENFTYNSLFNVNDARIARIGLSDVEAGVTTFIP